MVIRIDHTNRGVRSKDIPGDRMFMIVLMNLIDAIIEEAPAK